MSQQSVTILGAGIAGLTLGRALRAKGIPSTIYDRASSSPRNAYGITLQPWAYNPLLNLLGLDETQFRRQLAVDSESESGLGRVSAGDATTATSLRINRQQLETLLAEDQTIHHEHELSSAETLPNGGLELHFSNGTTLRPPRLVVDALGVHSPLRKTLLPTVQPDVHPFAVYSGKRTIPAADFATDYAPAFRDGNIIVHRPATTTTAHTPAPPTPRLEISINRRGRADEDVRISYIYSRAARTDPNTTTAAPSDADPLLRSTRTLAGASDVPPELYTEISSLSLFPSPTPTSSSESASASTAFASCFAVDQVRADRRVLHWLMRTVPVPARPALERVAAESGVVMVGDSVHATPILGGEGANWAVLDAVELAEALAGSDGTERGVKAEADRVKGFYAGRWQRWMDAGEESKRELEEMHRPVSKTGETA